MTLLQSIEPTSGDRALTPWRIKENEARRLIEERGYLVHDANILFRANCPNIDLVVYGRTAATYVQVKASHRPAGKDCVVADGSIWTDDQLRGRAPVFNRHPGLVASVIMIIDHRKDGTVVPYLAPIDELTDLLRKKAVAFAQKPKRDGQPRSIAFRKEIDRALLEPWAESWECLGERLWS